VEVDPDNQVLPVAGSKEAIFSTPLAFVDRNRGDTVVWATPGYPIYERGALLAGAEGHPVRLGGDFVLRAPDIPEEILGRASLVWTCSPHNPTGSVTSRDDLAELHAAAFASGALLCADECYADLYEDEPPASVLQVAAPSLEGALSYLSLSKRSGMTGYRSGVIVGDASAMSLLRALRTSTGTASAEFVQRAAIAAWGDDDHVATRRETFARKRSVLRKAFEALGMDVVASRAGLYCWVRVEDDLDAAERLLAHGVVVSPGRAFGEGGEGFMRLALVPTVEECEQAVDVLERAFG
jgi:aspartate/methionine/tyrosine aminotransferase